MKLEGLLEDVHLDEVLRVLAASGKSGSLHVETPDDAGVLSLNQGRVVSARVDSDRTTVAQLLEAADLLPADLLASMSLETRKRPIPDCFLDLKVVAPELAQDSAVTLAARLETVSLKLMAFAKGRFSFMVAQQISSPCYLGDQGAAVPLGIPADALLDKAREARQEARAQQSRQKSGTKTRMPAVKGTTYDILLVDDDGPLLTHAAKRLQERGLRVASAGSASAGWALMAAQEFHSHTVAVVDLVMPRVDGKGILGGLDFIKRLKARQPLMRIILTLEVDHPDAQERARELGVTLFVRKPTPVGVSTIQDAVTFTDAVLGLAGFGHRAGSVDLGQELMAETGEKVSQIPVSTLDGAPGQLARSLESLRDMVGPVNDPERRDEIPLMILRVASSVFSRAALFLMTPNEFVGLGGFGLDPNGPNPGKALRGTHIPLTADSVLCGPVKEKQAVRGPFFESEWNRYLADRLGGPTPTLCYVAPLFCDRAVEAVLYADNALDGLPLGDSQVVELFLTQAGAAMERASLEKRLQAQLTRGGAIDEQSGAANTGGG